MASQVFLMSLLLTVISHTVLTTSQPITNHAVKRHSGWWDSEESRKVWPFSHEDHDDHHHARHSGYDDFEHHQHHHHEHDENCGHRLTVFKPPSHRHHAYSGQSITPLVYPLLAPINDPSVITTTTTTTPSTKSQEYSTTTTTSTTRTRVKPPLEPAPIFEDTDDVPDGDIQVPAAFPTTLPIVPITEINTEAEKEAETTTTITTQPFSEIDLRFGA